MYPKRFKIAKWFIVANYIVIPLCFFFSIFFLYNAIPKWDYMFRSDIVISVFFALCGIGFAIGGIYSIRIIPRLRETILVTDTEIVQEHSDGTITPLSWNEAFEIRNRNFLGRVELISLDNQRTIMLEQQLDNYQELVHLINGKLSEKQNIRLYK